ncbi:hypothetical protein PMAYCL1PPCAC_33083, partial [Pristionchus mayeri]
VNMIQCTAIQITSTGNCVIFGAEISATFGQCPVPFTCLLRTNTGCVPKWRRPIDMGYIRHYCTGKIEAPPMDDGIPSLVYEYDYSNYHYILSALMHDGTNAVFENSNGGRMVSKSSKHLHTNVFSRVQTVNVYDDTTKRQINAYDTTVNRFIYCANKAYIAVSSDIT